MAGFANRVMVITGASSGIGRELARQLATQGARLVLAARDQARLTEVSEECRQLGAETLVVPTDVTSQDACRELVAKTVEKFGALDVLVNNAGSAMWSRFDELHDLAIIERLMRVNYLGGVYCTHAALPHLKKSRGLIVAMASISGLLGVPLLTGYSASKHAVFGFFESLRIELAASGVGVTILAPDFVQSEVLARAIGPDGRALETSPLDQRSLLSTDKCVRKIIRGMERRKRLVLTSERSAWGRWGKLLAPWLIDRIAAKSVNSPS
jgi:short-subunit dehydrogenase